MNATASDLKSAYVNYTKGGMIIEEIIPTNADYPTIGEDYWILKEVMTRFYLYLHPESRRRVSRSY